MVLLAAALAGCSSDPARVQSLYLFTSHVALFVDDEGRGGYVVQFQRIRQLPPLAELQVFFDRPDGTQWRTTITTEPGRRRWDFQSPVFTGFDREQDYFVRATLLGSDRATVFDRILQRVRITPAGAPPVDVPASEPDQPPAEDTASRSTR